MRIADKPKGRQLGVKIPPPVPPAFQAKLPITVEAAPAEPPREKMTTCCPRGPFDVLVRDIVQTIRAQFTAEAGAISNLYGVMEAFLFDLLGAARRHARRRELRRAAVSTTAARFHIFAEIK